MKRLSTSLLLAILLSGCSGDHINNSIYTKPPTIAEYTVTGEVLKNLPPAAQKIPVTVYSFADQTGQNKPNDTIAEFSRAVTQGGASIVNQALLDTANGNWFTVIERSGLENLLQERKIIRAMRNDYAGENGEKLEDLPPLLYAGMLIEGGIVAYESNTYTGGFGARYLGIGGNTDYRRDVVTVYLRAIKVATGEIILSTNTSKTIYSTNVQGGVYKYIGLNELLEVESGFTMNEPPQLATRQAIEMAVYSMIMEGAAKQIWEFSDPQAGQIALQHYARLKDANRMNFEDAIEAAHLRSLPATQAEAQQYAQEKDAEDSSITDQLFQLITPQSEPQPQAAQPEMLQASQQPTAAPAPTPALAQETAMPESISRQRYVNRYANRRNVNCNYPVQCVN